MESSMKMMSWSRYHCLSASLLRAERRYRAAKSHKTRLQRTSQRRHVAHPPASGADGAPTSYFEFVFRLFRT
jgi:hypothetical protein